MTEPLPPREISDTDPVLHIPPAKPRVWCDYPFPLGGRDLAYLRLPMDLSPSEAERIKGFVDSMVAPWKG